MSAAVAGSVGAITMMRNRTHTWGGAHPTSSFKDTAQEEKEAAYFEQTYTRHVTYMLFLKRMINNDYDNSFLQSLAEDIFNESFLAKILDLNDIEPAFLFIMSEEVDKLIAEIDRYILAEPCLREKYDDFVTAIKQHQNDKKVNET